MCWPAHYRSLDAVVTTTEADAEVYRQRMPLPGVRVAGGAEHGARAGTGLTRDGTTKVITAAGRLVRGKRFDLLIEAFSAVASKEPDWQLRIYGGGPEREHLQRLIDGLGLAGQARLMGPRTPIEAEFAKSAMVVSASDAESFGMTLVEAMRCGVPVISTDCPLGPAEIITEGVDGRLTPVGDARALAEAMLDLITDEPLRQAMGEAALRSSHRYDAGPIVDRYEALFTELTATRTRRAWTRGRVRAVGWARRQTRRFRRPTERPSPHHQQHETRGPVTPGCPTLRAEGQRRRSHEHADADKGVAPSTPGGPHGFPAPQARPAPHRPARLPGPVPRAARFRTAGGSWGES